MAKTKKTEKQTYNQNEKTEVYTQFSNYQNWLNSQGIPEMVKRNIDMYEGRQWPEPTERTENMPRPVVNVYAHFADIKLGNILGSPMHVNYISDESQEISNKFTKISEFVRKEAHEDEYDYQVAKSAMIKATAFKYYYFDENAVGKKGEYKGGVRMELIDIDNIAFADPTNNKVQSQKWIILRNRVELETAKELCENPKLKDMIVPDEIDRTIYTDAEELKDSQMVYVYTKLARIDGEVYFKKATKNVELHDYKPTNPKIAAKKIKEKLKEAEKIEKEEGKVDTEIDSQIDVDHDSELSKATTSKSDYKAFLYPINELTFKKKDKSIIGIPEFDDMIETQKSINANLGVATLNNLQMACPKWIVKENALQGQIISNKVGETLIDHTPAGQRGIDILQGQPITSAAYNLIPSIFDLSKTVKGTQDVMTGEASSKDLSGYAIAQLSAQAQKPIALLQQELWRHKEREAEIFRQFIILYYNEPTEYKYKMPIEEAQTYISNNLPVPEYKKSTFEGKEFENFEFDVIIEVGAGTQYSEIQTMSQLDGLLNGQYIDFMTYINAYPDKAMPCKQQLIDYARAREQSENAQLKEQIAQLTAQLEQVSQYTDSLEAQNNEYKKVASESQKNFVAQNKEFASKINEANKLIMERDDLIEQLKNGTTNQTKKGTKAE